MLVYSELRSVLIVAGFEVVAPWRLHGAQKLLRDSRGEAYTKAARAR
jgi:hypothetical protein